MTVGVFDLFTVGIGPSSSHTVGPMRASLDFVTRLSEAQRARVVDVRVTLHGSLAATGIGHHTPQAVLVGLTGADPATVGPDHAAAVMSEIEREGGVPLRGGRRVPLTLEKISYDLEPLPRHANGLTLVAVASDGAIVDEARYYSVGGGFILREGDPPPTTRQASRPLPFETAAELLDQCERHELGVAEVMFRNELAERPGEQVRAGILSLREAMVACYESSLGRSGVLPGPLGVRRRASTMEARVREVDPTGTDPAHARDWVALVALAVSEENATGGRIVTAPTNGAAGVIPAVLHYATHCAATNLDPDELAVRFFLTAAAIGALFKARASISGAEVGCQGEVGTASSMAAAGLAEVLGGTPRQVENAAEIAIEHHLGLTCDPVGGLVQIPCIERNAVAAGTAIDAVAMALWGDGSHHVTLDQVIAAVRETGRDMDARYKETSAAGLALSVVEC